MMTSVAVVTGGTGFVGAAVVRQLASDGWRVRVLARRGPSSSLPSEVSFTQGDIGDEHTLREIFQGAEVVHHLAGIAHTYRGGTDFVATNVGGSVNVAKAARAAGVGRVILYSSIAVYGSTAPTELLDETAPPRPNGAYASSKLAAESAMRDAIGDRLIILRLAAVYGPGLKGNYLRLVGSVVSGRYVSFGSGLNRRTLVFVDDVGRAGALVSRARLAKDRVFNITDGKVHRLRDIVAAIAACAARPEPRIEFPVRPAQLLLRLIDPLAVRTMRISPSSVLAKYLEDVAVSGSRIQAELDFRPLVGLREGWCRVVESLRRTD